jgi:hypothetical protein
MLIPRGQRMCQKPELIEKLSREGWFTPAASSPFNLREMVDAGFPLFSSIPNCPLRFLSRLELLERNDATGLPRGISRCKLPNGS